MPSSFLIIFAHIILIYNIMKADDSFFTLPPKKKKKRVTFAGQFC